MCDQMWAEQENWKSQVDFWTGDFGVEYTKRNVIDYRTRIDFFKSVINFSPRSILEVGANRGHNLTAISKIFSETNLFAIEPNDFAVRLIPNNVNVFHGPLQEFKSEQKFDLVFTCGVLIHIAPENLKDVCLRIADLATRQILLAEYFSEDQKEVEYRGHTRQLFVGDFGKLFSEYTGIEIGNQGTVQLPAELHWWSFEK